MHGGGFVPYQAGRWAHGWQVRPEPKVNLKQSPEPWIERFYYDTILHSKESLEFLVGSAGPKRVMLGSDYPYDMGTGNASGRSARSRSRKPTRRPCWARRRGSCSEGSDAAFARTCGVVPVRSAASQSA